MIVSFSCVDPPRTKRPPADCLRRPHRPALGFKTKSVVVVAVETLSAAVKTIKSPLNILPGGSGSGSDSGSGYGRAWGWGAGQVRSCKPQMDRLQSDGRPAGSQIASGTPSGRQGERQAQVGCAQLGPEALPQHSRTDPHRRNQLASQNHWPPLTDQSFEITAKPLDGGFGTISLAALIAQYGGLRPGSVEAGIQIWEQ